VSPGNDLEDLLVRTLRDPARALPAPTDPVPAIVARARAQRRHAVLGVAAVILATVAALVVPMSLRTTDSPPPATGRRAASLLEWPARGPLTGDTALIAEAERAWRDGSSRRPAGAVSLLWAGPIGGGPTVLLQGRDVDGTALVALTTGDPQRVIRVDPLPDPGIAGVRLAVGTTTFMVVRPDAASVWLLEDWGASGWEEHVPADGLVAGFPGFEGRRFSVRDAFGQVITEGTVAEDGSLPLAGGPVRLAAPTWRRTNLIPLGPDVEVGRQLAKRLGDAGTGPVEVAALEGGFGGKPAELRVDGLGATSWLYEVRRDGRTWLASGVRWFESGAQVRCLRLTEITGRVAETQALVTRCWLPEQRVGVLLVHLAHGVRLTGVTLDAAGSGQRPFRHTGDSAEGLAQGFRAEFPTGPGRVTLADARGKALPPVEVPAYS
jgi:hypothetical protein